MASKWFEQTERPVASVYWKPVVREFIDDVSASLNFVALIHQNISLYGRIKSAEEKLDSMNKATIAEIIPVPSEWSV